MFAWSPARRLLLPFIATLLVLLILPGVACAGSEIWFSGDELYNTYATFGGLGDPISIDGRIAYTVGDDMLYNAADIYIVPSGNVTGAMQTELKDVSGQPNTLIYFGSGTFTNEIIGYAGSDGLTNGRYDIVIDEDRDQKFTPGVDTLYHPGTMDAAITIKIREDSADLGAILQMNKTKQAANDEWRFHITVQAAMEIFDAYKSLSGIFETMTKAGLKDNAAKAILDLAVGKIEIPYSYPGPLGALKKLQKDLTAHWLGISADPPDPQFAQNVVLAPESPLIPNSQGAVDQGYADLALVTSRQDLCADALLSSMEKYQGADAEGEGYWALTHARGIQLYANLLAEQSDAAAQANSRLYLAMLADTLDPGAVASQLGQLQTRMREQGLSSGEYAELLGAGYTQAEIEKQRQDFLAATFNPDKPGTLAAVQTQIGLDTAAADACRGLVSGMDPAIADLVNYGVEKTQPLADAGGPYTGTTAGAINLDASASSDPRSLSLTYSWDLDGDGIFDDASGASPTHNFGAERHGFVGVKVANEHAEESVSYAAVDVTYAGPACAITALAPSDEYARLFVGESLPLSVTTDDPTATFAWMLGDAVVGTGPGFTFTPLSANVGANQIAVDVVGGGGAARPERHIWTVDVVERVGPVVVPPILDEQSVIDVGPYGATLRARMVSGTSPSFGAHIEYRRVGVAGWTALPSRSAPQTSTLLLSESVTGLAHGTEYEFRTAMVYGNESRFGDTTQFSTTSLGVLRPTIGGVPAGASWPVDTVNASNVSSFTVVGISPEWTEGWAVKVTVSDGIKDVQASGAVGPDRTFAISGVDGASLADGPLSATASLTDPQGAEGPQSSPRTILLDTEGPALGACSPDRGSFINYSPAYVELTFVEADSSVDRMRTTVAVSQLGGDASRKWTNSWSGTAASSTLRLTPSTRLGDGNNPYVVTATTWDEAGNSKTHSYSFTIDTQVPILMSNTSSGAYNYTLNVSAYSYLQETSCTIYYTSDGSEPTAASTRYTGPVPVSETVTLRFLGVDQAGNKSAIMNKNFLIDRIDPQFLGMSPPNDSTVKDANTNSVFFFVADTGGSGINKATTGASISGPAGSSWTETWNADTSVLTLTPSGGYMPDGAYTVNFAIHDLAGNGSYWNSRKFSVDRTPPTAPSVNPVGGYYSDVPLVVRLVSNEPCTYYYTTDGSEPTRESSSTPNGILLRKSTTLRYFAVDAAGWESPKTSQTYTMGYDVVTGTSRTYTTQEDFRNGLVFNTNPDTSGEVRLNATMSTFNNMWIANAGEDTLSRIDTKMNREIGRYRTWFGPKPDHGSWDGVAPSRTCVDSEGNCYVANRQFDSTKSASVMKVLANSWIDRNGNGVIDTAFDINGNGTIDDDEILPMIDLDGDKVVDPNEIQDERIAWIVEVGPKNGLGRSLAIDPDGNIWLGLYNAQCYYKISPSDGHVLSGPIDVSPHQPYGALVDSSGTLWGESLYSNSLLKLDTRSNTKLGIYSHASYGSGYSIALGNGRVYIASYDVFGYLEFDPLTDVFTSHGSGQTMGIATDSQGNIYIGPGQPGAPGGARLAKYRPDGTLIWTVGKQSGTGEIRGISVDSEDNVWLIHRDSNNISKHRGSDGAPLGVFPIGAQPYTYSDATGISRFTNTSPSGTWSVVQDSGTDQTPWGKLSWNTEAEGSVPGSSSIVVEARASDTQSSLVSQPYIRFSNGIENGGLRGRFIQVRVSLLAGSDGNRPILSDLSVEPYVKPNSAPIAVSDSKRTLQDTQLTFPASDLTANDLDADDDPLSLVSVATSADTHGSIVLDAGAVTYTPEAGFRGVDSFTYEVSDGRGGTDTGTVSLEVTAVNHTPSADAGPDQTVNERGNVTLVGSGSDPDGDPLALSWVQTAGPTVTLSDPAVSSPVFPAPSVSVDTTLTFELTVSDGVLNDVDAVDIGVRHVNRAPVLDAIGDKRVAEGSELAFTVTATDPDGDALTFSAENLPSGATFDPVTRVFSWTPTFDDAGNYPGIVFSVVDGDGAVGQEAISVTVADTNRAPVAAGFSLTTPEDAPLGVTLSASDADEDPLLYTIRTQPLHGTLTGTSPNLTYTPEIGYAGPDGFTYEVSDGKGGVSTAEVTIEVTNVNRAPVADAGTDQAVDERSVVMLAGSGSDPDGDALTLTWVQTAGPVVVVSDPSAPAPTFTAPTVSVEATLTFELTVSDGMLSAVDSVDIGVRPVNRAPVLDAIGDKAVAEGEELSFKLRATDPDGDALTFAADNLPSGATLDPTTGAFIWRPTYDSAGSYSGVAFSVSDGNGGSDQEAITITVADTNRAPVTASLSLKTPEDTPLRVTLSASHADADTPVLAIEASPAHGVLTGAPPNLTYTPSGNWSGSDSFTFTASDSAGARDTGTISIEVLPVNDSPAAAADSYATSSGTTLTVSAPGVLSNDTDVDSVRITALLISAPANGKVVLNADGSFEYVPKSGFSGSDSFTYVAHDGAAPSATALVSINVTPSGQTPRASKRAVLAHLQALAPTLKDCGQREKVQCAIQHLNESLAPSLWLDDAHLVRCDSKGSRVFEREKDAVNNLHEAVAQGLCMSRVRGDIDALVAVDRELAVVAIADAVSARGVNHHIVAARKHLALGDAKASAHRGTYAIDEYRNAWREAAEAWSVQGHCEVSRHTNCDRK